MQLLMRRPEIDGFVSIAPPANMYDFSFLAPCPSSGLIVHGDEDQLVPIEAIQKLIDKLMHQRDIKITYKLIEGADHFFLDRLPELDRAVQSYVGAHHRPRAAAAGR
jgi:uncharacterized protein